MSSRNLNQVFGFVGQELNTRFSKKSMYTLLRLGLRTTLWANLSFAEIKWSYIESNYYLHLPPTVALSKRQINRFHKWEALVCYLLQMTAKYK